MGTIRLKRGKVGPLHAGHPWVFSGAIDRFEDDGNDVVHVVDDAGKHVGYGLWSPNSSIRVRLLSFEPPGAVLDRAVLAAHFEEVRRRRARYGFPGDDTDVFRFHNSEGDGIGGLTIDCLGPELVTFQLSTRPLHKRREAVVGALTDVFGDVAILETPTPPRIAELEGFDPQSGWRSEKTLDEVVVSENGVRFAIDPANVQKTGHYADMRPHREWIAAVSRDRRVFDGYCYTGAFALYAARAGAAGVLAVDSSESAIRCGERNAALNEVDIEFRVGKVDDALRSEFDRGSRYGVVVLDPPKLAPSRKHTKKALRLYESLAVQGARILEPDGILAIGSCSEAIGVAELEKVFGAVQGRTSRNCRIVHAGTQAADHPYPAAMPEGRYLTFVAAEIGYLPAGGRG